MMKGDEKMQATTPAIIEGKSLTIDTPTLMGMLHCGRKTAVEVGVKAAARVQVGKRVLWNAKKIEEYLDSISE